MIKRHQMKRKVNALTFLARFDNQRDINPLWNSKPQPIHDQMKLQYVLSYVLASLHNSLVYKLYFKNTTSATTFSKLTH